MADRQPTPKATRARLPLERELEASTIRARRRGPVAVRTREDLHVCPACASELVYPTDWEPTDAKRWRVALRCPECEWTGGGIYAQAILDRFDEALDRGTAEVLDDLRTVVRSNLEDEIDRFVAALRADHILAEDF